MPPKIPCLLGLAAALHMAAVLADGAAAAPAPGGIRISIENKYEAKLDFGPLGKGSRKGKDRVEGVLNRQGQKYVGIVDAVVESTQGMAGLVGGCGPARYEDSQKLKVIGYPTGGFNDQVQTITFNQATSTGSPGDEYLMLEFIPETRTTLQPQPSPDPTRRVDQIVSCHTLIETPSGISFLPLNDSRWTQEGGGYIIVLPSSGILNYTDTPVPIGAGAAVGPFEARESVWTIQVERLP